MLLSPTFLNLEKLSLSGTVLKYSKVRLVQYDQLYELISVFWEYVGEKVGFGVWFFFSS